MTSVVLMYIFFFHCLCSLLSGRNSAVECQLPKLDVVGSSPIARSINLMRLEFQKRSVLKFVGCIIPVINYLASFRLQK